MALQQLQATDISAVSNTAISGSITSSQLGTSVAQFNGMKNRIINGAMVIDQRNAGGSVSMTTSSYSVDRYRCYAAVTSKMTVQQNAGSVTPPVGFTNYMGFTTSSGYSPLSTERFIAYQGIEGYNVADLQWGTANAKTVTVSFWVRSSLTGTFNGVMQNDAGDRSYIFTYTINSANTWEYKTVTVAGDTTGTWLSTNGGGIYCIFNLGTGSAYTTSSPNSWLSGYYSGASGAQSVVGTTGATFYITGLQLEVGSSATGFEYRQYGQELQLCQRYYQTTAAVTGSAASSTIFQGYITYGTQMRIINPTLNLNTVLRITDGWTANPIQSSISFSINQSQNNLIYAQINNFSGLTQGRFYGAYGQATSDTFTLSAEL